MEKRENLESGQTPPFPSKGKIPGLEKDIETLRHEASETIQELKADARLQRERAKTKAGEIMAKAGGKVKGVMAGTKDKGSKIKETLEDETGTRIRKTGKKRVYVGLGIMVGGVLAGLITIFTKRAGKERPEEKPVQEQIEDALLLAGEEGKEFREKEPVVTSAEYQAEKRRETQDRPGTEPTGVLLIRS